VKAEPELHPVLRRQLRRFGIQDPSNPPQGDAWQGLLERITRFYTEADQHRYLLERSLAISSSEMQQLYEDLRASSESRVALERDRLQTIISSIGAGLCTLDQDLRLQAINPEGQRLLGWSEAELIGRPFDQLISVASRRERRHKEALAAFVSGGKVEAYACDEALLRRRDTGDLPVSFVLTPFYGDESLSGAVLVFFDLSERKRVENALAYQAVHDALTGLPNRVLLQDRLQEGILQSRRAGGSLALLLLDLNGFKEVNDTFGHSYGDRLLVAIGPRLQGAVRESDTVARLGGDEFAVIMLDAGGVPGASLTAARILAALEQPFAVEDQPLEIGASIGIALYPDHGEDAETLLRHADTAMYVAKRSGDGFAVFGSDGDGALPNRVTLTSHLRHGIEDDELVLEYQPKVDLITRQLRGVEALVRWKRPGAGVLPPDRFIPLAEQTGLIRPLTRWVLNTALAQCRAWREGGLDVNVAVNLSMRNLQDAGLPALIDELLDRWQVPAEMLKLEVTESVIMANPTRALEVATLLRERGVALHLDDFGTGYSSLSQIKRLPLRELKIDRSFVLHLAADEDDAAIVRSTIDLGHNLGLVVVAEGVENRETWDLLREAGCDVAQGYFVSHPLSGKRLEEWLRSAAWHEAGPSPVLSRERALTL